MDLTFPDAVFLLSCLTATLVLVVLALWSVYYFLLKKEDKLGFVMMILAGFTGIAWLLSSTF